MHSSCKHGPHWVSPLVPKQGCPQGNILSQVAYIRSKHSGFLQTQANAAFNDGDGSFKGSKQNLHSAASYWSQVLPMWYGSLPHLTQKFFSQALHLILFSAICLAASCEIGWPLSSFWPWMTSPASMSMIFSQAPHWMKLGFILMMFIDTFFSIVYFCSSVKNCISSYCWTWLLHFGQCTFSFWESFAIVTSRRQSMWTWWKHSEV